MFPTDSPEYEVERDDSISVAAPRHPGAFQHVECPVCGGGSWTYRPMDGVFCDACNVRAALRPSYGEHAFTVLFDAGPVAPEYRHRAIPEDANGYRRARVHFYERADGSLRPGYADLDAVFDGTVPIGSWTPAWLLDAPVEPTDRTAREAADE